MEWTLSSVDFWRVLTWIIKTGVHRWAYCHSGHKAVSSSPVNRCYKKFHCRSSLSDQNREGRPKSVVEPEKHWCCLELEKEDRDLIYREIDAYLWIGMTSISKKLEQFEQQSIVWLFQDSPNPSKIIRSRSTSKQMIPVSSTTCLTGQNVELMDHPRYSLDWAPN